MDWLQAQQLSPQSTARLRNTLSGHDSTDPVEQFAQMERLVRTIIAQRDEEVATQARQNQEHQAAVRQLPTVEEWQTHQTAFKQLEAKFIDCMDKMSRVDEERTRLESLNAQLEMEASTVGEYVTLFAHRRAAAARRARAREQLLGRLVEDRRRLRARLRDLLVPCKANHTESPVNGDETIPGEPDTSAESVSKVLGNQETQAKFLSDFQLLLHEIGPSTDETEFDLGFSLQNDEDAAEQDQKPQSPAEGSNENNQSEQVVNEKVVPQLSVSPLEQLRKQALQHDCPHCQCCVGNLIEV
ncbi:unnamed protein product [Echinostoma caproni]|uniref:GOLGA2L5 domain-containing protein n=1 Tax=Echinostoma caproni TaxID=27848 RepID=A0A183AZ76_9TREM|nr:unnamed protein product [Echinostoma caproni]